jgi:hypothetical protein
VQVHCDGGVAIYIGPESCAASAGMKPKALALTAIRFAATHRQEEFLRMVRP